MRHKYETRGIVLARTPLGETSALIILLTSELGLVRARAQSVRRPGAKLAASLATFAESSLVLVRGKEGWRIAGAVLETNWFTRIPQAAARDIATRVSGLLLRLVAGEVHDPKFFSILTDFFEALSTLPEDTYENLEVLTALRVLAALGLDAGEIPGGMFECTLPVLAEIADKRAEYIARINRGITSSGL